MQTLVNSTTCSPTNPLKSAISSGHTPLIPHVKMSPQFDTLTENLGVFFGGIKRFLIFKVQAVWYYSNLDVPHLEQCRLSTGTLSASWEESYSGASHGKYPLQVKSKNLFFVMHNLTTLLVFR